MSKLNNFNISTTNTNISYRNYVIPDDEYENGEFHHPWALPLGYGQQDGCGNGGGIVDHRGYLSVYSHSEFDSDNFLDEPIDNHFEEQQIVEK